MAKVSAVVPIHNEEKTVAHVLNVLLKHKNVSEIICVDDGSTDNTKKILGEFRSNIKLINLPVNKGKGNAMVEGALLAKEDRILFIDADLAKLTSKHITLLTKPLLQDKYLAAIGFPMDNFVNLITTQVGGQRVYFKKDIQPLFDSMRNSRYGVEILLNKKLGHLKTKRVPLTKLGHIGKGTKRKNKELVQEATDWMKEVISEYLKQTTLVKEDYDLLNELKELSGVDELERIITKIKDIDTKDFIQKLVEYIEGTD